MQKRAGTTGVPVMFFTKVDNRQTALTKNVVLNIRKHQIIIMSCNNLKLVLYVDVLYKIS